MRWRLVSLALVSVGVVACSGILKTDFLVDKFNGGLLETGSGDPHRNPDERARSLVTMRMRHELGDAFFGQGASDPYVADWMQSLVDSPQFVEDVLSVACGSGVNVGEPCGPDKSVPSPPLASPMAQMNPTEQLSGKQTLTETRRRIRGGARRAIEANPNPRPSKPLCEGALIDEGAVARFADEVRWETAYERATFAAAALLAEHVASKQQVARGAAEAFKEAAGYLRDRGWKRTFKRPPAALVVKGGAAAGVFSAGAVWAVLNVIDRCMNTKWCRDLHGDIRFEMLAGTSTGAMVVAAVDRFNNDDSSATRAREMSNIADWFTCRGMSDLYCVRSAPALDLVRDQDSLLDFNGIQGLLRQNISCTEMKNRSELILNTVDFRSGQLFALSDQDKWALATPEDVVQGALASAVLPVIARPVYTMPANYDAGVPMAYLDGGIRSEIPLMSVVRRGAGRALVIGSSSSVPAQSGPLTNALKIMTRYIDVSVSGLIETELAQSQSHAQSLRLSEADACVSSKAAKQLCTGTCNKEALCAGDWEWACKPRPNVDDANGEPRDRALQTLAQKIAPMWRMAAIFRDEERVDTLHGYSFDPPEQRRMFMAGADSVRVSCTRVADLLGIGVPNDPNDPKRREIIRWCSPEPPGACKPQPKSTDGENDGKAKACRPPSDSDPKANTTKCRGGR